MIEEIITSLQQLKRELDENPSREVLLAIDRQLERLTECITSYELNLNKLWNLNQDDNYKPDL